MLAEEIALNLLNNPVTGTFIFCAVYIGLGIALYAFFKAVKDLIMKYLDNRGNNDNRN